MKSAKSPKPTRINYSEINSILFQNLTWVLAYFPASNVSSPTKVDLVPSEHLV